LETAHDVTVDRDILAVGADDVDGAGGVVDVDAPDARGLGRGERGSEALPVEHEQARRLERAPAE
jgi:hypothetical protein